MHFASKAAKDLALKYGFNNIPLDYATGWDLRLTKKDVLEYIKNVNQELFEENAYSKSYVVDPAGMGRDEFQTDDDKEDVNLSPPAKRICIRSGNLKRKINEICDFMELLIVKINRVK